MTKTEAISRMFLEQMERSAAGTGTPCTDAVHVKAAFNAVFGNVITYDEFVSDLYDQLREKAAR